MRQLATKAACWVEFGTCFYGLHESSIVRGANHLVAASGGLQHNTMPTARAVVAVRGPEQGERAFVCARGRQFWQ